MINDYYAILGLPADTDLTSIQAAYRRLASQYHPDHGGSHESMTLLNEAYLVLSNPKLRAQYDEARASRGPAASWTSEVSSTRQEAQNYPKNWKDFDAWLNRMADDVRAANYGSVRAGYASFPTARGSTTGNAFIFAGGAIAVVIAVIWASGRPRHQQFSVWTEIRGYVAIGTIAACGGAWLGKLIHNGLKDSLDSSRQVGSSTSMTPQSTQASRIVSCPNCEQRIRLPASSSPLAATCPKCRFKFDVPP
jgi:hypothetical protein